MDLSHSEVIVLEDISDSSKATSQPAVKSDTSANKRSDNPSHLLCNGDDEEDIDEVPDFDDADLEVLDCWEDDVEDQDQIKDGSETQPSKGENSPITSNLPDCRIFESKQKAHHVLLPDRHDKRTSSCESDATILFEDLTHLDDSHTIEHQNSSKRGKARGKSQDIEKNNKHDKAMFNCQSPKQHVVSKEFKSSRKEISKKEVNHFRKKMSEEKDTELLAVTTETKVENFLKEMALQHPLMFSLQENSEKSVSLDSVSSASSKNLTQGVLASSTIDPSDLPPGVDLAQVEQDTSTSSLLASAAKAREIKKQSARPGNSMEESSTIPALMDPSQKVTRGHVSDSLDSGLARGSKYQSRGRSHTDTSKGKERHSRSPYAKQHSSRSSRSSPPHKMRKTSPARSFTLSPSPSPKSKQSRSPLTVRPTLSSTKVTNFSHNTVRSTISSSIVTNFTHNAHKYINRPQYQCPSMERSRYRRSPLREPSILRELSRSLSRDRIEHHSRSKEKSYTRHRSRSRHRFSSKEERVRRYRDSSSRSWSPGRRGRSWSRSRSRSPSRHRYVRRTSPSRDEIRPKRMNTSRSMSRSRSPWKPPPETSSIEWRGNYRHTNGMPPVDEEVKLEHDMARFIATNIAATGLLPSSVTAVRGWLEPANKPKDTAASKVIEVRTEPILDHGMPLPPPPPDISELMTADEIGSQTKTSPDDQNISLSSLLESAMSGGRGSPSQAILDRCQDAIMKLHDGSIKPGRFAVICSIGVPHVDPPYSFQPWQSALNRSVANKIHLSFSKFPDQPIYWDPPKPKLQSLRSLSPTHKQGVGTSPVPRPNPSPFIPSVPVSSTDLDRTALLEKITYLTRELHDVRQILDRRSAAKKDACVQTFSHIFCQNCGDRNEFFRPHELGPLASHAPKSEVAAEPVPVPQPNTASLPVSAPVPYPGSDRNLLSNSSYRAAYEISENSSALMPTDNPIMISKPGLNWQTSVQSSPMNNPGVQSFKSVSRVNTDQQITTGSNDAVQPTKKNAAPSMKVIPPLLSGLWQSPSVKPVTPAKPAPAPSAKPVRPAKLAPSLVPLSNPVPPAPPKILKPQQQLSVVDFNVSNYQMIGDEHLFDLISYFRSVGTQIKFDPYFCSPGLNVERLLKNVVHARLCSQIILMIGFYDGTYSHQVLNKYHQLVGYLRKRCHHLVLIEPPPIPKWGLCKKHWKSFSHVARNFVPPKADNISVVYCHSFLLEGDLTPNNSMFVNSERLNQNGLKLIADELLRIIFETKKMKFGGPASVIYL